MDFNEFAEKVKAKHPQYADRDNKALAEAMVKKFPEYASKVTFEQAPKPESQMGAVAKQAVQSALPSQEYDQPLAPQQDGTLMGAAKAGMQTAFQTLRDPTRLLPTVQQPGQLAGAKAEEKIGGVTGKVAGVVIPLALDPSTYIGGSAAKGGLKPAARALGGKLEALGARGQNFAAELRPATVENMITKATPNPGDIGTQIGNLLSKERIVGATPKATMDNLIKAHKRAGEEVGQAIKGIHGSGLAAINAEKALKPLLETVQEYRTAITGTKRSLSKHFEEVLTHLQKQSSQDGMLSFDDVTKALKEIGPLTSRGSDEAQHAMSLVYGKLANVRDEMITEVANKAKNPNIKKALLEANKKFSTFTRIMPDIERSAAKEAVGASSPFAGPYDSLKKYGATKASGLINRAGTSMKGFGLSPDNMDVLSGVKRRLSNERGVLSLGRPASQSNELFSKDLREMWAEVAGEQSGLNLLETAAYRNPEKFKNALEATLKRLKNAK